MMHEINDVYGKRHVFNVHTLCLASQTKLTIKDEFNVEKEKIDCFELSFMNNKSVYISVQTFVDLFTKKQENTQDNVEQQESQEKQVSEDNPKTK